MWLKARSERRTEGLSPVVGDATGADGLVPESNFVFKVRKAELAARTVVSEASWSEHLAARRVDHEARPPPVSINRADKGDSRRLLPSSVTDGLWR